MMRPRPPLRIRRWRRGEAIGVDHMNEVGDAMLALHGGIEPPRQIAKRVDPRPFEVRMFRVKDAYGDYVACERHSGNTDADSEDDRIYVAKPWMLRRTPFDGTDETGATRSRNSITYDYSDDNTRTATDSNSYTEEQVIVPQYLEGDIIYAVRGIRGGTGVVHTIEGEDTEVNWLDINVDGRFWGAA